MSTETVSQGKTESQLPAQQANESGLGLLSAMVDDGVWARICKIAEVFSKSTITPDTFRGNQGNCIIALQLSMRMGVDPFMLMQNMYIVQGRPGLEAKFAIAMCNTKGVFQGRIKYDLSGEGDSRQCMAYAFDRETGERVEETVTIEIAKKEGWYSKKGSKWQTIPDLMLKYRSAMWLIRTTCPEVLMGMQSTDELNDIAPEAVETTITDDRPKSEQLAGQLEKIQSGNGGGAGVPVEYLTPREVKAKPQKSVFDSFKKDMEAAPDAEALERLKADALAESQQGNLKMDEWESLLAHSKNLMKSFEK